jgi:hypothetical protein
MGEGTTMTREELAAKLQQLAADDAAAEAAEASRLQKEAANRDKSTKDEADRADMARYACMLATQRMESMGVIEASLLEADVPCSEAGCAGGADKKGVVLHSCRNAVGSVICASCDHVLHNASGVPCSARYVIEDVEGRPTVRQLQANEFLDGGVILRRLLPLLIRPPTGCPACGSHRITPSQWDVYGTGRDRTVTVSSIRPGQSYEASPATEVTCGKCCVVSPVSTTGISPAGVLPVTLEHPLTYVDVASLEIFNQLDDASLPGVSALALYRAMREGSPHLRTVGYAALRRLVLLWRCMMSTVLPGVGARKMPCLACNEVVRVVTSDGNWDASTKVNVGGPQFHPTLAGGLLLNTNVFAAVEAVSAVSSAARRTAAENMACGSNHRAATESTVGKADVTDIGHVQLATCAHGNAQVAVFSLNRETFAATTPMTQVALALGATHSVVDVYCRLVASWIHSVAVDGSGFQSRGLTILFPEIGSVDITCVREQDGPAPTTSYHFTLAAGDPDAPGPWKTGFVTTALGRVRGLIMQRLKENGCDIVINGVIPSVHAYNHKCKNSFGARAVPGAANADEHCEQIFAWLTHRFVHMKNMGRTTAVLFMEQALAAFNSRRNADTPERLLAIFLRALKKYYYVSLPELVQQEIAIGGARAEAAYLLRQRVLRDFAATPPTVSAALIDRMTLASQIAAIEACVPPMLDTATGLPLAPLLRDSMFAMMVDPTVNATAASAMHHASKNLATAAKRVQLLRDRLDAMGRSSLEPVDVVKVNMDALHDLLLTVTSHRAQLASGKVKGLKHASVKARIATAYAAIRRSLALIAAAKDCLPAEPARAQLRAWAVPSEADVQKAGAVPTTLDDLSFGMPPGKYDAYLDAFNEHERALEYVVRSIADVTAAAVNCEHLLAQLRVQMTALTVANLDIRAGSAGVFTVPGTVEAGGTAEEGLPIFTLLPSISSTSAAAGLACYAASEIRRVETIVAALHRLRAGIALLPAVGRSTTAPARANDKEGVRLLLQYGGQQLLRGTWTPTKWASAWTKTAGAAVVGAAPVDDDDAGEAEALRSAEADEEVLAAAVSVPDDDEPDGGAIDEQA